MTHKSELHLLSGTQRFRLILNDFTKDLSLSEALLKYETLDVDDIKSIIEHKKPPSSKLSQASSLLGLKPGLQQLAPVASLPGLSPPPIESLGSSRKNDGAITS